MYGQVPVCQAFVGLPHGYVKEQKQKKIKYNFKISLCQVCRGMYVVGFE